MFLGLAAVGVGVGILASQNDDTLTIVSVGLISVGALLYTIVVTDTMILWVRPQKPSDVHEPRRSDYIYEEHMDLVFTVGDSLSAGWDTFKHHGWSSFFFSLAMTLLSAVVNFVPALGTVLSYMVNIFMIVALVLGYQRHLRGEELTFLGFVKTARNFEIILECLGLGLLVGIFTLLAMPLLGFFFVYLSITWSMLYVVFVDPALHDVTLMEKLYATRKIFHYHAWRLLGFNIASFFVVLLGLLCLIFGVFVALPVIVYAQADIYYGFRHRRQHDVEAHHDRDTQTGRTETAPLVQHVYV